jgi:hypothetical protein
MSAYDLLIADHLRKQLRDGTLDRLVVLLHQHSDSSVSQDQRKLTVDALRYQREHRLNSTDWQGPIGPTFRKRVRFTVNLRVVDLFFRWSHMEDPDAICVKTPDLVRCICAVDNNLAALIMYSEHSGGGQRVYLRR